jgi:hypothetical protein
MTAMREHGTRRWRTSSGNNARATMPKPVIRILPLNAAMRKGKTWHR